MTWAEPTELELEEYASDFEPYSDTEDEPTSSDLPVGAEAKPVPAWMAELEAGAALTNLHRTTEDSHSQPQDAMNAEVQAALIGIAHQRPGLNRAVSLMGAVVHALESCMKAHGVTPTTDVEVPGLHPESRDEDSDDEDWPPAPAKSG
eukprot:NODE_9249_length_653_cov_77.222642_g8983_i0.p1 GENE.NODE_9249_length_653_cov_77.222642_g8983_i0~~NODE_9249_length_653_cov_77.222642_g8983_i0.p1  ORF type:complete len:148 (+),score=29.48 NODE_9249_length_653_cov_77.222642_g8983_i0:111-554(+)